MTDTNELDPKLAENPHYWLYRATREQIKEAEKRGETLEPQCYLWNLWAVKDLNFVQNKYLNKFSENPNRYNTIMERGVHINRVAKKILGKSIFDYAGVKEDENVFLVRKNVDFQNVEFKEELDFSNFIFPDEVDFQSCQFTKDVKFARAIFSGRVNFSKSQFGTLDKPISIDFWRAEFEDNAYHDGVKFYGTNIYFKNAKYMGNVIGFVETEFHFLPINNKEKQKFSFENTVFMTRANFSVAKFYNIPCLKATDFRAGLNLDKTKFLPELSAFHFEFYEVFFKILKKLDDEMYLVSMHSEKLQSKIDSINKFFNDKAGKATHIFIEENPIKVVHDRDDTYLVVSKLEKEYGFTQYDFKRFLSHLEECLIKLNISIDHQLSTKEKYANLKAETTCETIQGNIQTYEDASITWHALSAEMEKAGYHDQALKYFGYELEAKRLGSWENKDYLNSAILWCYKKISNYGESIIRPLVAWLILIPIFAFLHFLFLHQAGYLLFVLLIIPIPFLFFKEKFWIRLTCLCGVILLGLAIYHDIPRQSIQLSLKGSIPFVSDQTTFYDRMFSDSSSKAGESDNNSEPQSPIPFDNTLELYIFPFLHGLHTIFSLLCLFLFGLGVRNRLRLK